LTGGDRQTRLKGLRTWLTQAAEEVWGLGAAKDRAAHISKILSIADNATESHFKRWEKNGTGFYKAYSEFATPQANPAADKKKPEVVKVPTQPIGNGKTAAATVDDPMVKATEPKSTQEVAGYTRVTPEPAPENDPTVLWATRIDQNKSLWKKLLDNLTEKKSTILEPDMVLQVVIASAKKAALFRNSIALLLQNEEVQKQVVEFIKDNPTLFDGINVEPEKKAELVESK
jgi:hypothetical protein